MSKPKMLQALHPFEKKDITPKKFISEFGVDYQEKDIFPKCLHCGEKVYVYGVSSTQVVSRFKHFNGMSCQIHITGGFGGKHPGFDFGAAERIKKEFCQQEIITKVYALCLNMVGKGNFSADTFIELWKKADQKHIWSYVGLEVWMIPYILLTLSDITLKTRDKQNTYDIRFVLDKNSDLRSHTTTCNIEKLFVDSQKVIKSFPVNEDDFYNTNADWISGYLLTKLLNICN